MLALLLLGGLAAANAGCGEGEPTDPALIARLDEIKRVTNKYRDVEVAERDGYRSTERCMEAPDGSGSMGVHYEKRSLVDDQDVDLLSPEQLLYEQQPGGKPPKLVGVEYYAPAESDRPEPLPIGHMDGPMHGHFPGQPTHYDLHVWVHRENPEGVFDIWNPEVECR